MRPYRNMMGTRCGHMVSGYIPCIVNPSDITSGQNTDTLRSIGIFLYTSLAYPIMISMDTAPILTWFTPNLHSHLQMKFHSVIPAINSTSLMDLDRTICGGVDIRTKGGDRRDLAKSFSGKFRTTMVSLWEVASSQGV
jgi:hypothetical protein